MTQEAKTQKGKAWLTIACLCCVPLLMVLGNSVLIPEMPQMQKELHISKFQVSLMITLFSVPAGIIIPFAGFLSDKLSRKIVLIPSLLLFGIGGVAAGLFSVLIAHPYIWILVSRVVQGIGASGTAPIAMAWIGDLFTGAQRSKVLGINEAGNAFGKVISPILGSAVALLGWYVVFYIFPVLCVPLAIGLWKFVPNSSTPESKKRQQSYAKSLIDIFKANGRWLITSYLAGASALFTLFGVLFYLSDLLETKYHIDGIPKGLILAIPLMTLSITSFITGAVIQKKKIMMKWLLVIGFCILAGSLACAAWLASNAWILVALMSVGSLGTGMLLPCLNMFITSAVSQEQRGAVTSLYGSVRFLGVAAGPPVFTWLLTFSPVVMFVSVSGLSVLCGCLCLWLVRPPKTAGGDRTHQSPPTIRSGRQRARI